MSALTSQEVTHDILDCTVYNSLQDLSCYLQAGTSKTSYGSQTDVLQEKPPKEEEVIFKSFKGVSKEVFEKLLGTWRNTKHSHTTRLQESLTPDNLDCHITYQTISTFQP